MTRVPGGVTAHYDRSELASAVRKVGIGSGDVVFSHVGMGMLGYPLEGRSLPIAFQVVLGAFRDVLGPEGTLVVPTYTLSFCRGEDYDPDHTPSRAGPFTEMFRRQSEVERSQDPILSVAVMGPRAKELIGDLPSKCFGPDSVYDRLLRYGGIICNVGVGFRFTNFVHHVETVIGVPYRYDKLFRGQIIRHGVVQPAEAVYHVRALLENTQPALSGLEEEARARGVCRSAVVGRGEIVAIRCEDLYRLCAEAIRRNPWALVKGPPCPVVPEAWNST